MTVEFDHQRKNVILWMTTRDSEENVEQFCELYAHTPYHVITIRSGNESILPGVVSLLKHNRAEWKGDEYIHERTS